MVAVTRTISVRDLGRYERRLGAALPAAIKAAMWRGARAAVMAIASVPNQPRDLGGYAAGWAAMSTPTGVVIRNRAPHAIFVERGRRPGARQPPAAALAGWVIRHWGVSPVLRGKGGKFRSNRDAVMEAAWMLSRAIARRGIAARPLLLAPNMRDFTRVVVDREVKRALDALLAGGDVP